MPIRQLLLTIALVLIAAVTWAEESAFGPYEAEVPVADQSEELRRQAVQEALGQVLEKVAQTQELPLSKVKLERALANAERYVQQYRYTEQGLWVLFDRRAIDGILERQTGIGPASPETLLLKISGIHSLPDYAQVIHYLGSLKSLSRIQPRMVEPGGVLFELESRNGKQRVVQTLVQDRFLRQEEGDSSILSFHYAP